MVGGCGDGQQTGAEQCDLQDFGGLTCLDFGFDSGGLACESDCAADTSGCVGDEHCADGEDNDGDDDVDCSDADCSAVCGDPCAEHVVLPDPGVVTATTEGRSNSTTSSCAAADDAGPEVAYRFVAANTGTLEIELEGAAELAVAVHATCDPSSVELTCESQYISLPVTQGDELYVVVEATTAAFAGEYTLTAFSRENGVCGDGYRDENESCDDGDTAPNDGCGAGCELESVETEQNGTFATADQLGSPHVASIEPAGDVDFVAITLDHDASSIVAEIVSLGEECARNRIDSVVQLFDVDGATELASDDDSGDGQCSRVVVAGLDAGTYYVRVAEFGDGENTFPYELLVKLNRCGDAQLGPGETCDDGDTTSGDGCSATCQEE